MEVGEEDEEEEEEREKQRMLISISIASRSGDQQRRDLLNKGKRLCLPLIFLDS